VLNTLFYKPRYST